MKKLTIILSCVLLLAALTLTSVFASAGSAELAAGAQTVQAGQTVEITASLSGFSAVDSLSVTVELPDGVTVQEGKWVAAGTASDYMTNKNKGVWTKDGGTAMSAKTDVFRLTCLMGEPAVGQQELNKTFKMTFRVMNNGNELGKVSASVSVKLVKPATSLSISKQTLALDLSGTKSAQLTASYGPENTTDKLSWSSSNAQVATVDASGKVTAVAEGEATVTAAIGALTKTCKVTVSCGHTQKTEHAATEPTCKATGNNKYYTCNTCADVFKADGTTETTVAAETLPVVSHKGGTATCSQQAKCQWCQQPYGDKLPHTFTEQKEDAAHLVAGSGANCQQVKQYYYDCAKCDAVSNTEKWNSQTYGEHQMENGWTTVNGEHYHKCAVSGCTHKTQKAACSGGTATCQALAKCSTCAQEYGKLADHAYTGQKPEAGYLKTAATCKDPAVYVKCCAMCDRKDTDLSNTFSHGDKDPQNHTGGTQLKNAKTETCGDKGYTGDTWCLGCDTELSKGRDIAPTGNHAGGTATCTKQAVCTTCSQSYGQLKAHAYAAQWSWSGTGNSDTHYQLCSSCGVAKQNESTHSFSWVTDTPATEDATGIKHEECAGCKVKRSEGTVIDKLPHKHVGITRTPAKAATCVATGNVEYWTCASAKCAGKYFGDADCATELTQVVTQKDASNHTGTELRDVRAASCYQDGYTGDTWCTGCNTKVASGTVLGATGDHKAGAQWFTDGGKHYHACTTAGCSARVEEADHSYQWKLDKAATEDATGLKHEECVCGAKRSEGTVIPKLDHTHTGIKHYAAVKATCVKEGTVEYWTCASAKCAGKYYGDSKCQLVLQTVREPINKNNHTGATTLKDKVEPTCSISGYSGDTWCNSCQQLVKKGAAVAPTGKHTPKAGYVTDDKQHWQICAQCGDINGYRKEAHTYKWVIDQAATESQTGLKHQVCSVCGYTAAKNTVIDKLPHDPVHVDGKACTCTEDGVLEHYLCGNCGRYYASANGQAGEQITKEQTVLKATGHTFGTEWKTDDKDHWHVCACGAEADKAAHTTELVGAKEATLTETGYTGDEICTVCELTVAAGQEIPVVEPEPEKSGVSVVVIGAVVAAVVAAGGVGAVVLGKKRKK